MYWLRRCVRHRKPRQDRSYQLLVGALGGRLLFKQEGERHVRLQVVLLLLLLLPLLLLLLLLLLLGLLQLQLRREL